MLEIVYTVYPWKFGVLFIAATPRGICQIEFDEKQNEDIFIAGLPYPPDYDIRKDYEYFKDLHFKLNLYFAGEKVTFDEPLDFLIGTDFQKRVWQEVARIPYGQVRTYGEIAKNINNPKAVRAVGSANAKNPIPILVPCHRVVAAGGKLGGYGGGLDVKKYLLRLEGAIG